MCSSSIDGRNSCSGGSSRRTVTGSPSIASRTSSKSARWTSSSSASASFSSSGVDARIILRTTGRRSGARNMCSVRHSPMPSAPRRRALAASSPVSALARTPSLPLRIASAQPRTMSNSFGGSASASSIAPSDDLAGGAVDRDDVALADRDAVGRERALGDLHRVGADDGRGAPAAGDDRGVADEPAAGREDALAGHHPVDVLGARLAAHEDDLLAALGGLPRRRRP